MTDAALLAGARALVRRWRPGVAYGIARAASGGSTPVLQLTDQCGSSVGFLRLAEEPGEVRAAGHDLARISQVVVHGYGWVDRVAANGDLIAEHALRSAWTAEYAAALTTVVSQRLLPKPTLAALQIAVTRWLARPEAATSRLAHGDFDASHLFVDAADRRYLGIIDFGEIRGADAEYDLSHALLWAESPGMPFHWRDLAGGYGQANATGEVDTAAIQDQALAIGVRQLARFHAHQRPTNEVRRRLTRLLANVVPGGR